MVARQSGPMKMNDACRLTDELCTRMHEWRSKKWRRIVLQAFRFARTSRLKKPCETWNQINWKYKPDRRFCLHLGLMNVQKKFTDRSFWLLPKTCCSFWLSEYSLPSVSSFGFALWMQTFISQHFLSYNSQNDILFLLRIFSFHCTWERL